MTSTVLSNVGSAKTATNMMTTVSGTMNLNIDQEILAELPPNVLAVIAAIGSVLSILSFVQFILGGTVNLGYTRFLLDQHDGNELNFRTLFSQFDRFGVGFLQKFLRGLYIFLWSLLLIVPGIVKTYSYAMTPYIRQYRHHRSPPAYLRRRYTVHVRGL